ncbi:MAG: conserved membrane protein of unknown function [Promethearchaeota archaeon]|nr:MAG: conserved membrane protein of unknown function [Candidatus Lokiarchaeota archaeon]
MNSTTDIISLINFLSLVISIGTFGILYIISLQPMKRSRTRGEKAWEESKQYRMIGGFLELVSVINIILWIWFPLPAIGDWKISEQFWVGIVIGVFILVPCVSIMTKGMIDAGSESLAPSQENEMYGGIYKYIRHPQTIGEFPIYVALAFMVNSWFLVFFATICIIIYIPIMIYYEEKDLVLRFGDKYREYQKTTGALFPKFRK